MSFPMEVPLTDTKVGFAQSWEDIAEFMEWLKKPRDVLAFDTETSGFDPWEPGARIRLAQFGDVNEAWSIDAQLWPGIVQEVIQNYPGEIVAHNGSFDYRWLATMYPGIKLPWSRTTDTMLLARIDPESESAALKPLSVKYYGQAAAAGQRMLDAAMEKNKWTWNTVPLDLPAYSQYAALDCILTARLYRKLHHIKTGPTARICNLEHEVRRIANNMELRGFRVDRDYCQDQLIRLEDFVERAKSYCKETYDVQIGSTKQLGEFFLAAGEPLPERTATGSPKMSAEVLQDLAKRHELADLALKARKSDKVRGTYFENILKFSEADGRIHAQINTIEARTGRMCLPTSHKLVTRRGVVSVDDIEIGDETIDENGNWTTVREVFRYEDQETVIRQSTDASVYLEATAEHRWVTRDNRGTVRVEPISSDRQILQLTPESAPVRTAAELPQNGGNSWPSPESSALIASFRTAADPMAIALSLNPTELRALLRLLWVSGITTTSARGGDIICASDEQRDAIAVVAYRRGYRSRIVEVKADGRSVLRLDRDRVPVKGLEVSSGRSDVWCVRTDSGTFTAWGDGAGATPYLTGNSITKPALQTLPARGEGITVRRAFLPSEGHLIYSADYSSIESRLAAHYGKDANMIEAFRRVDEEGADFFTDLGRTIWGPDLQKDDPRRAMAKTVTYAGLYGAGAAKMAAAAGVTEEEMTKVKDEFFRTFPAIQNCQKWFAEEAAENLKTRGYPFVTTDFGRELVVEKDKMYTGANYKIQSHAAEILKQALVNFDMSDLGDFLTLPIHDEVVLDVPADYDPVEVFQTMRDCMEVTQEDGYLVPLPISPQGPMDRWDAK